jgi:hypothetical protein
MIENIKLSTAELAHLFGTTPKTIAHLYPCSAAIAVPPHGHPNSAAKLVRTSGLIRNASVEPPQKGIGRSFTDEG